MIQGIDIFEPHENGLPDFSKISVGQIFNGSVAAGMNQKLDPYGFNDKKEGVNEPPSTSTIDPLTGKRVEVRRAQVVDEMNGASAARRGHTRINAKPSGGGGGYSYPEDTVLPDSPTTGTPGDASLLNVPNNDWHPPMAPDYVPPQPVGGDSLFPPLDLNPQEAKSAALRKLPTLLLDELKNLHLV